MSYGDLVAAARTDLDVAVAHVHAQHTAEDVTTDLLGYERFLRVAATHLAQLRDLTGTQHSSLDNLIRRIRRLEHRDVPDGPWARAAASLGAAHDLVATHTTGSVMHTHEAEELIVGPASLRACATLVGLIVEAEAGAQATLDRFRWQRRSLERSPELSHVVARVRSFHLTLETVSKAALWELEHASEPMSGRGLEGIKAAPTRYALVPGSSSLEDRLNALRLVRQIARMQAVGRAPASPESVRDITRLGMVSTDPDGPLPRPTTGLGRVRTAHAQDRLAVAHAAWRTAGAEFAATVRGVTKAPHDLQLAVATVLGEDTDPFPLRLAIAEALPRLATDASATVNVLTVDRALLTKQPVYAQPRREWRPITAEQGADLASCLVTAGSASVAAAYALRDLQPHDENRAQPGDARVLGRQRVASRELGGLRP
ncbi:hypothetical protein [Nocardioides korecus]